MKTYAVVGAPSSFALQVDNRNFLMKSNQSLMAQSSKCCRGAILPHPEIFGENDKRR
jgi:hypothetical protein